jgi:prepilin-type N-terminal cleavage/methylation domain-containing protein
MPRSKGTIGSGHPDGGFTLVELLAVVLLSAVLLAAFTAFYLSEQHSLRHHQIEVETSQNLRVALDQMVRDIRVVGLNVSKASIASFPFVTADATAIRFKLDADADGAVTTTSNDENKGFQITGTTIEKYDATANSFAGNVLADDINLTGAPCNGVMFTYRDCNGNALTAPVASPGSNIASVDVCVTAVQPVVGGLPVRRTETESIRLRNVCCGSSCP